MKRIGLLIASISVIVALTGCSGEHDIETSDETKAKLVLEVTTYFTSSNTVGTYTSSDTNETIAWEEIIDINSTGSKISLIDQSVLASYNSVTNAIDGHPISAFTISKVRVDHSVTYDKDIMYAVYDDHINYRTVTYTAEKDVGLIRIRYEEHASGIPDRIDVFTY